MSTASPKRNPLLPPIRPDYSGQIRALKVRASVFFDGAIGTSIAAIACRIGAQMDRKFVTERQGDGVRVWRLA